MTGKGWQGPFKISNEYGIFTIWVQIKVIFTFILYLFFLKLERSLERHRINFQAMLCYQPVFTLKNDIIGKKYDR